MITGSCITIKYWNFTTSIHNYGISLFHLSQQSYKQTLKKKWSGSKNIPREINQWENSLVTEDIDFLGLWSRNSKKSVDHEELFNNSFVFHKFPEGFNENYLLTLFLEQKMKSSNLKETFWIMKATCIN